MDSYKSSLSKNAPPIIFERAKTLRKVMTEAERILWQKIRNKQFEGLKFRRQHAIDNYILDFYCHEKKLGKEVDGQYHNNPDVAENDVNRTYELGEWGITVIRFTNDEVINNISKVLEEIKRYCL